MPQSVRNQMDGFVFQSNHEVSLNHDISLNIGSVRIKESKEEKLLGVILDKKLCFKQQVKSICKKAGQKLHALSRISHFLDTEQLKRIMRAFILS